jgi:hypothetical protein
LKQILIGIFQVVVPVLEYSGHITDERWCGSLCAVVLRWSVLVVSGEWVTVELRSGVICDPPLLGYALPIIDVNHVRIGWYDRYWCCFGRPPQ